MGEVYRARDTRLERDGRDQGAARRQGRRSRAQARGSCEEAQAASALNHPTSSPSTTSASDDGIDFIVMEYVRGKTARPADPAQGPALRRRRCDMRDPDRRRAREGPRTRASCTAT